MTTATKKPKSITSDLDAYLKRLDATRVRNAKREAKSPAAQSLRKLLRDIEKRAEELRVMVYDAMDCDDSVFLILFHDQGTVDSVRMDLNASPRDLGMLRDAVDSNLGGY